MNALFRSLLFTTALATLSPPASAVEPESPQSHAQPPQNEEAAYIEGVHAMSDNRWSDAVTAFEKFANSKSKRSDAALYWKAYALAKLSKPDLANATCLQLHTQYPASYWNRDCAALQLANATSRGIPAPVIIYSQTQTDNRDASSKDPNAELKMLSKKVAELSKQSSSKDPDADIKMLALNSLVHRDPAQAIPILRTILTGDQPDSLKKHALFVLAQSRSPEADALMHDLVLGKTGVSLQLQAIQACSIYQGRRSGDTLAEAYRTSSDLKIKRAVISALFVSGDDQHLVTLARTEKDLELKRTIVSQLTLMNGRAASDYMLELLK